MTVRLSVTETRNALRCPRVFALGRARGAAVMFPIGASAFGALFHRLVAELARRPGTRLHGLPAAAPHDDVAHALFAELVELVAAELERNESYATMPAEVDDLTEALREFARHVAAGCAGAGVTPAQAVARFLAEAELALELEVGDAGAPVKLTGRIDALHAPPGGALEVVEYKLTDESGEDLDRAQVALYRFLLARGRELDAAPVILRFHPRLTVTRIAPAEADRLVEQRLLPLLQDMARWVADPRAAPPTERRDLCPACPMRGPCATTYPDPLPVRDEPPSGATRPRPDARGDVQARGAEPAAAPAAPVAPADEAAATGEAEAIRDLVIDLLRTQGVRAPTASRLTCSARVIQVQVTPSKGGSVAQIDRSADDVVHRLEVDHQVAARFARKGPLRVFTVERRQPRTVRLGPLLAAKAPWLRARPGRCVLGETVDGEVLVADLSDPSSCHLLVGGTTGSGKSVLLRGIASSLVHLHEPGAIQLTLIDPKRVTFGALAAGIAAHLSGPIAYAAEEAIPVLEALIEEMELRYALFEAAKVQDVSEYNELQSGPDQLARRVVIMDEFGDLVAVRATREAFVDAVQRLGAKARAAGIHLVLATQRPTREFVPGGIKANLPGQVALKVASAIESRIILDEPGAEHLLGKGDLLAKLGQGAVRGQAPFDGL